MTQCAALVSCALCALGQAWQYVVLDEGHVIRNPDAGPVNIPFSLVPILPVLQYLLELASEVWHACHKKKRKLVFLKHTLCAACTRRAFNTALSGAVLPQHHARGQAARH